VNPALPAGPGLTHHVLASKALGHDVGYVVWLPPGYAEHPDQRFPVIYFLHGAGGNESADSAGFSGQVAAAIEKGTLPPVICVFPNGVMSGYRGAVETMILDELIPLVDRDYRTIAKAPSRAFSGFSMGGAGSIALALRHPEVVSVVTSWGGGSRGDEAVAEAQKDAPIFRQNGMAMMFVNGDQDRPDACQPLADELIKLGIANTLLVLPKTPHNLGLYYSESAAQTMAFIGQHLKK
jgi:endo-1,4-beta-xylanase